MGKPIQGKSSISLMIINEVTVMAAQISAGNSQPHFLRPLIRYPTKKTALATAKAMALVWSVSVFQPSPRMKARMDKTNKPAAGYLAQSVGWVLRRSQRIPKVIAEPNNIKPVYKP